MILATQDLRHRNYNLRKFLEISPI